MSKHLSDKPNIQFIMADQMTPFMAEACGGGGAPTRHLSALAKRGTWFRNAYTPSPLCSPGHFSFMTGLQASKVGSYDNGDPFQSCVPTFARYLTNQGYETVLAGRMHFIGADQLHGLKRRLTEDVYPAEFI
jgi:choline-sulfatase